jgi:hypothetical protein
MRKVNPRLTTLSRLQPPKRELTGELIDRRPKAVQLTLHVEF